MTCSKENRRPKYITQTGYLPQLFTSSPKDRFSVITLDLVMLLELIER